MLYSNRELITTQRQFEFGAIWQVAMGESGRGRKIMALTCPPTTKIIKGINTKYTIGFTKSGRARILEKNDKDIYLMLSSQGGYTRRGDGRIKVLKNHLDDFSIISRGNGADGDAGRIGTWDVILMKLLKNSAIVCVRPSGTRYDKPCELYLAHNNVIYHCIPDELPIVCDQIGIDTPCSINCDDLVEEEWVVL